MTLLEKCGFLPIFGLEKCDTPMRTFAISFQCNPSKMRKSGESPVECSISVNGERCFVQLPKTCKPDMFRKLLNSNRVSDIKTYCEDVKAKINAYQTFLAVHGQPITAKKIKAHLLGKDDKSFTLLELCNEYLKTKVSKPIAYAKYKNTFARFREYLGDGKEIAEITTQDIINYKVKWEEKFAPGTMRNEMKKLKSLFLFAFNSGRLARSPWSSLQFTFREEPKPYLSYDEIVALRDLKLDDRLDRVRNIFLFLCFSGLEWSDLLNLKKEDVQLNKYGQLYCKKKRIKTGVEFISIFYEDAEELWHLFDGNLPYPPSNQKMNLYLKEIAEAAGIQKTITTLTARHTYATYLLSRLLIPVDVVQKMLGHTSPRQSLAYAKMLDDAVFQANLNKYTTKAPEATKEDMEELEEFSRLFGI